jgi:hypothetical protein
MDRLRALAETTGSFTRADALDCGYDDKAIARAVKAGRWTRIRAGAYTFRDLWSHADELARHRATARAVMKRLGPSVALSHISAVIDHGLPAWSADLSLVHVTRLDGGAGRTEAGVVHHEGLCLKEDVIERDGCLVMKPARRRWRRVPCSLRRRRSHCSTPGCTQAGSLAASSRLDSA